MITAFESPDIQPATAFGGCYDVFISYSPGTSGNLARALQAVRSIILTTNAVERARRKSKYSTVRLAPLRIATGGVSSGRALKRIE
jgi:hypothetical protein